MSIVLKNLLVRSGRREFRCAAQPAVKLTDGSPGTLGSMSTREPIALSPSGGHDLVSRSPKGQQEPRTAVTRVDLVEAVYQRVGLSRAESARLVELVFKEITDCLERGETVKLSSFGSFIVRTKGPRVGRNPKTGIEVPIARRQVVVFKASDTLRKRLATVEETTE